MKFLLMPLFVVAALVSSSSKDDDNDGGPPADGYAGYMYTSTNDSAGNGVIVLGRKNDGTVTELPGSPYTTGAAGDAAEGDFDTQWGLRIEGDYLLVINPGANPVNSSISVFKFDRSNGSLTRIDQNPATPAIDNMDSHGIRAASVASMTKEGTTWVVVGNQHSFAGYLGTPGQPIGTVQASALRNLTVFTLNPATGVLTFRSVGPIYKSGLFGGPNVVEFNPAGTKLITSTEGIPHAATPDPSLKLQKPGRLYIYDFAAGALTQTGMFEEAGMSGETGAVWSPNGQYVYLLHFNLNSSKEDHSVTVHDGTTAVKVQNFATSDRNDEDCWSYIGLDHTKFYSASFAQNTVNVFDIGADGKLSKSLTPNFFARKDVPANDAKDLYEAGGYLFVLGSLKSHSITTFKIADTGALTEIVDSPYRVPSSAGKTEFQQDYVGLTGFEK